MTMPLCIYRRRRFHRTWEGVNRPRGWEVTVSARTGVPDGHVRTCPTGKWSCRCTSMGRDRSMEHEMAPIGSWVTASARIVVPDKHTRKCPMGKWPCRCTSTGQEGSIKLEMELLGPAVLGLQRPQELGWPTGMSKIVRRANDLAVTHLETMAVP